MHRRFVVALCALLVVSACASHDERAAPLEEVTIDGVLVGSVVDGDGDGAGRAFAIDEVVWDRGPHRNAEGALVIPDAIEPGDEIRLVTDVALDPEGRYVVLAARPDSVAPSGPWGTIGILDAGSHEMVETFLPAPRELLLPGESGPEAEMRALVELLGDVVRHRNARELPRPVSRRLARATQLTEVRGGGNAVVEAVGMPIEEYLVIDPSLRVIPPMPELPPGVVELLDLEAIHAAIVLPAGFAADRWGIGLVSPAGLFGPIRIEEGQRVVEFDAVRQRGSGVTLVAWPAPPTDPRRALATGVAVGDEALAATIFDLSADHEAALTLVIDLARGTVSSMPPTDASELAAAVGG